MANECIHILFLEKNHLEVEYRIGEHDPARVDHQRRHLASHGLSGSGNIYNFELIKKIINFLCAKCLVQYRLVDGLQPAGVEGEAALAGVHDGGDHAVLQNSNSKY